MPEAQQAAPQNDATFLSTCMYTMHTRIWHKHNLYIYMLIHPL